MIFIIALVIFSYSYCTEYTTEYDAFANFAKNTHRVYTTSTEDVAISDFYITPKNTIILKVGVIPHEFIKINNLGEEVDSFTVPLSLENRIAGHPVVWDSSFFIVVGENKAQIFKYNFTPYGSIELNITNTTVQLTSIIKDQNYYYVGGYIPNNNQDLTFTVVARFTLNGVLDTTFNSNNTPGYIILGSYWGPHQMLMVDNHLMMKTSRNSLISLSINNPSNITLAGEPIALAETANFTIDATGKSIYAYGADYDNSHQPTLFKYNTMTELDTTLNNTGKYIIDFMAIAEELSGSIEVHSVKAIKNQLFILGTCQSASLFPFILCYSTKTKVPQLDTTFNEKGYWIGDPADYPFAGVTYDIVFSETLIPSLFFSCGRHLTQILLGDDFIRKSKIVPQTIAALLKYNEARGNTVPLLAGMFR